MGVIRVGGFAGADPVLLLRRLVTLSGEDDVCVF